MPTVNKKNILALDVGERRIGVAVASPVARLARPLTVLANDDKVWAGVAELVKTEDIGTLVIGLPRDLRGQDTDQTRFVRRFEASLKQHLALPTVWQDEALTSRQAEAELRASGKQFAKGDIDALAATYILEDYLGTIDRLEE